MIIVVREIIVYNMRFVGKTKKPIRVLLKPRRICGLYRRLAILETLETHEFKQGINIERKTGERISKYNRNEVS